MTYWYSNVLEINTVIWPFMMIVALLALTPTRLFTSGCRKDEGKHSRWDVNIPSQNSFSPSAAVRSGRRVPVVVRGEDADLCTGGDFVLTPDIDFVGFLPLPDTRTIRPCVDARSHRWLNVSIIALARTPAPCIHASSHWPEHLPHACTHASHWPERLPHACRYHHTRPNACPTHPSIIALARTPAPRMHTAPALVLNRIASTNWMGK